MEKSFESWAIVELMGHVKMAGKLTEEERFGAKMGRIDIPKDDSFVTQYFGGSSVYRITPCTEETARRASALGVPAPVHEWQLPAPQQVTGPANPLPPFDDCDDDEYLDSSEDEEHSQ